MMRVSKTRVSLMSAILLMAVRLAPAMAVEPRPWLCRDKPVFSSSRQMSYEATSRGGRWMMTFMRFDPAGGHDGFTVVSARDLHGRVEGTLEPGQWYAVALYRSGGHWICPGNAGESDRPAPGLVRDLCYGEEAGSCPVRLSVRASTASAPPARTAP
jgi:hypothetical protein